MFRGAPRSPKLEKIRHHGDLAKTGTSLQDWLIRQTSQRPAVRLKELQEYLGSTDHSLQVTSVSRVLHMSGLCGRPARRLPTGKTSLNSGRWKSFSLQRLKARTQVKSGRKRGSPRWKMSPLPVHFAPPLNVLPSVFARYLLLSSL